MKQHPPIAERTFADLARIDAAQQKRLKRRVKRTDNFQAVLASVSIPS